MSGSATEATNQPVASPADLASGAITLAGFTAAGAFRQVPANELVSILNLPNLELTETTATTSPTPVPGMPVVPASGGFVVLQGQIVAQNRSSWLLSVWNIALVVYREGTQTNCLVQGDIVPSIQTQDPTMAGCGVVLGANSSGPTILLIGLSPSAAPAGVNWAININVMVG
jgi:hypothetical protein